MTVVEVATVQVGSVTVAHFVALPILIFAGTVATAVLLLASGTVIPPVGARSLRVTLPVTEAPPVQDVEIGRAARRDSAPAARPRAAKTGPRQPPRPARTTPRWRSAKT